MDRQIENCDFVLLVCTEQYYKKVMGTVKIDEGLGVKWESTLSYQHIYNGGGENTRFIPILFKDGKREYIPAPLRGATYYYVETAEGYEGLYRRLIGQPKTNKPTLGKLKSLTVRKPKTNFFDLGVAKGRKNVILRSLKNYRNFLQNILSNTIQVINRPRLIKLLYYTVGIIASLMLIIIYKKSIWPHKPESSLKATVLDCVCWKAPLYIEEELIGMQKVSNSCNSLKMVMPDDDTLKKAFSKVHEFASEIISEIERLEPCEANNVALLRTMYSIIIKNDGSKVCEDIKILVKDAKYIEFEKEGEKRQKFQDRILVLIGSLDSSMTIEVNVWTTSLVNKKPEFKITSSGQPADVRFN